MPSLRPLTRRLLADSLIASVMVVLSAQALAGDPFSVSVTTTSGSPSSLNVRGNDLTDLGKNLVKTQNQFQSLDGQSFSGSLRYGGLNNAVTYSQNADATSATIRFPTTGFSKTFSADNSEDLKDQIRDFLKSDGSKEYARFLKSINQQTQIGVTDGNPLAATALLSNAPYDKFGFDRQSLFGPNHADAADVGLRLNFSGGGFSTGDNSGSGWYSTADISGGFRFGDRVGLVFGGIYTYRDLDGAQTHDAGFYLGLPVLLVAERKDQPISWQLTPTFLAGAAGSLDQAAGGTFLCGAITSSLSIHLAPVSLIIANQISFLEGYSIHVGDYDFHTDLSQQIVKNGVRLNFDLSVNCFLDVGVSYTNFLRAAAVDGYWTPTAGIGFRFNEGSGIRIGYQGDFGRGFNENGGMVLLYFSY